MVLEELPDRPWQVVSTDLFKEGKRWVIVITYKYSRYFEISELTTVTSKEVIGKCKAIFSRRGIPEVVRADSGTQFQIVKTSAFQRFAEKYGFRLIRSRPYIPQANGVAEAAVIAKSLIRNNDDSYLALLLYRNIPIPELGKSPAQLLMNRSLRDIIPIHSRKLSTKMDPMFL